jgi:ABC-2 type transport system permease protein
MSPQSGALPHDPDQPPPAPALESETRPMYWSVRRELWENRSLYLAPLIVAALVLFATAVNTLGLPKKMRAAAALGTAEGYAAVIKPFAMAPAPIMLATFLIAFFYCLDALYGERRDRSILFWKSLPVSDRTTVLSKAGIPLVVLPLIAYTLSVITQVVLLQLSTMLLLASGMSPVPLWAELRFFQGLLIMLYGLTAHVLWFAPIYGWLLLVSVWARRAPLLWAVLPLLAVSAVERILFSSTHSMALLRYRFTGAMTEAFASHGQHGNVDRLSQLDPVGFLSAPGLWAGLLFAAVCLASAVRLRRKREPI